MKNNLLKIIALATYPCTALWIVSGIITIGSIYLSSIGLAINIIVGIIFILIGVYFYLKEKSLLQLLANECVGPDSKLRTKVIAGEIIFIIMMFLVGVIILSAVLQRVFGDGVSVFG